MPSARSAPMMGTTAMHFERSVPGTWLPELGSSRVLAALGLARRERQVGGPFSRELRHRRSGFACRARRSTAKRWCLLSRPTSGWRGRPWEDLAQLVADEVHDPLEIEGGRDSPVECC